MSAAEPVAATDEGKAAPAKTKGTSNGVNLFDPAATISRFLTRRFGIVGGLAFVALLASTEGYEVVKALLEKEQDVADAPLVTLDSGLQYRESKVRRESHHAESCETPGLPLAPRR